MATTHWPSEIIGLQLSNRLLTNCHSLTWSCMFFQHSRNMCNLDVLAERLLSIVRSVCVMGVQFLRSVRSVRSGCVMGAQCLRSVCVVL